MTFTEDPNLSFSIIDGFNSYIYDPDLTVGDFDNDGDEDILYGNRVLQNTESGLVEYATLDYNTITTDYINNGDWIDFDNDGNLDIRLNVSYFFLRYTTKHYFYENTGSGFEATDYQENLPFLNGFTNRQDYDNDGDLDVILNGFPDPFFLSNFQTKLYENIGSGFVENTNVTLPGIWGDISWKDYDNDGDWDILLTGEDNSDNYISKLYKNTGNTFVEDTNIILPGIATNSPFYNYDKGFHSWIDYDIDGDWDLLLTGNDNSSNSITKLYENIDGNLTENTKVLLPTNINNYSLADYDNDGDSDILVSIKSDVLSYNTKLYENQEDRKAQLWNSSTIRLSTSIP
ncbi:MAG: VCBS repeat-containing protein, partial [Okeania sp. SIO2F4]|uniref:FG-GAP repeat domain-containing protein n=1 Tax=Okeania sp. SIO2F4 TaxID=2607790 RepID=UPI00142BD64D